MKELGQEVVENAKAFGQGFQEGVQEDKPAQADLPAPAAEVTPYTH